MGGVGNKEEKEKEQARLVSYPDEKEGGLEKLSSGGQGRVVDI